MTILLLLLAWPLVSLALGMIVGWAMRLRDAHG